MASTSTIATVEDQLVAKFAAALPGVQVEYAWPGPDTRSESVFLGYHPETRDIRIDGTSGIPTVKAGRQQRNEEYTVPVTIWVIRPDLTPQDAKTARDRAFVILGACEDVLAEDPRIGLTPADIQWAQLAGVEKVLWPFLSGWSCELIMNIDVKARLT